MLYIDYRLPSVGGVRNHKTIEWHVGQPVPSFPERTRVLTFQADGHELELILAAMGKVHVPPAKVQGPEDINV